MTSIIGSSLPPLVEGQLRCFLSIRVKRLEWGIPQPPKDVQASVLWWGEKGKRNLLRPEVSGDPTYQASDKLSEIHFPIRCGPRQFKAYVQDMGLLHFDIVYGPTHIKFAKVDVKNIGELKANDPLDSVYPVYCVVAPYESKQVGSLHIYILFKTISDTYNVNSSIVPTTDKEFALPSTADNKNKKSTQKKKVKKKGQKSAEKKHVHISQKSPERINYTSGDDRDQDISFVIGPGAQPMNQRGITNTDKNTSDKGSPLKENIFVKSPQNGIIQKELDPADVSDEEKDFFALPFGTRYYSSDNADDREQSKPMRLKESDGNNILSGLLEKGQQLRDNMIKSSINSQSFSFQSSHDKYPCAGDFLKSIVVGETSCEADNSITLDARKYQKLLTKGKQHGQDLECAAVNLLLGDENTPEKLLRKLSDSSGSCNDDCSELSDPLHDSSLLSELFYTTKKNSKAEESSIIFSDDDCGGDKKNDTTISEENKSVNVSVQNRNSTMVESSEYVNNAIEPLDSDGSFSKQNNTDDSFTSALAYKKLLPGSVSVEKLTMLGRAKSAKFIIHDLTLCDQSNYISVVYFVEFNFPISTGHEDNTVATETICNVSRKIENNIVVSFDRISLFPLVFNEGMVNYWWNTYLHLKFFVKHNKNQKHVQFGESDVKLRDVLLSEEFKIDKKVEVYDSNRMDNKKSDIIGRIQISIELSFDHMNTAKVSSARISTVKNIEDNKTEARIKIPVRIKTTKDNTQSNSAKINAHFPEKSRAVCDSVKENHQSRQKTNHYPSNPATSYNEHVLQNLMLISEGKDILVPSQHPQKSCNLYCISRVFWSKEIGRTKICWKTTHPCFQFQEIVPVTLCEDNLKKMKNNMMVIEVWNKSASTTKDKLIGMCKVSLNQYYLSFKNQRLADTILNSQYPVISTDEWLPVIDVFTGKMYGSLKVLHAIGTHDQVMQLLAMKGSQSMYNLKPSKKDVFNRGEHEHLSRHSNSKVEHTIEITIEGVKEVFQNTEEVWGESDCYIQYNFPQQTQGYNSGWKMSCFKSKTTLCVPNLIFNHLNTHTFSLAKRTPVQHALLKYHTDGGTSGQAEITFELWKRQYYPNVRDQFIAKGGLPLAKLCAIMTMHNDDTISSQSYHLPLYSLDVSGVDDNQANAGSLDIFVSYRNRPTSSFESEDIEQVMFSVSILRVCGLKSCALCLSRSRKHHSGLNCYVRFYLSFMGSETSRETNVVARSYSPTFLHHIEFPLSLCHDTGRGRMTSLAELMEYGFLNCEIYHCFNESNREDEIVALGKVPLVDVLSRNSGVRRWFTLNTPKTKHQNAVHIPSCGIEVDVQFTNSDDRKLVINTGRGYGWCPSACVEFNEEAWLSSKYARDCIACQLDITLDKLWIPHDVMDNLLPHAADLERPAQYLYARYKFYDKAPVVTSPCILKQKKNAFMAVMKHRKRFEVSPTTSFAWYLHEEFFEIQYWMTSSTTLPPSERPHYNDKLVGSSYIALSEFSHSPYDSKSISGIYNLFKNDSEDICDVKSRVSILFNYQDDGGQQVNEVYPVDAEQHSDTNNECNDDDDYKDGIPAQHRQKNVRSRHSDCKDIAENHIIPSKPNVSIQIEEALHLPKYLHGEEYLDPEVYVSYQLPEAKVISTDVIKSVKPKWSFRTEVMMDIQVLKEKRFEFKLWRCVENGIQSGKDLLIGVAEIDTSPLFYGLKQLNGWYNVHDFNGRTVGQIKVGIVPSGVLSPSCSAKYFKRHEFVEPVNLDHVFFSTKVCETSSMTTHNPNSSLDENNTSRSMLFEQLKLHLHDLGEITSRIKNRSNERTKPGTCQPTEENKRNFQPVTAPLCNVLTETDVGNHANLYAQDGIISKDFTDHIFQSDLEDAKMMEDFSNTESHVEQLPTQIIESTEDEIQSFNASLETAVSTTEEQPLNDSTDDLLEHLRDFEKKYKHLKEIVQNDSDFEDDVRDTYSDHSDNENYHDANQDNPLAAAEIDGKMPSSFSSPRDTFRSNYSEEQVNDQKENDFVFNDEVVNVSSGEHTREHIEISARNNGNAASSVEHHHEFQERRSNADDHTEETEDEVVIQAEGGPSTNVTSCGTAGDQQHNQQHKTKQEPVTLPNFFMRPQELAQSMKALRIAANFRNSPRNLSRKNSTKSVVTNCSSESDVVVKNSKCVSDANPMPTNSQRHNFKYQLHQQLPVEASEMARIASIFSSK